MTICLCIVVWLLRVWPLHVYMFIFPLLAATSQWYHVCTVSFQSWKYHVFWYCVIICNFSWARMWLNDSACGPSIPRSPWSTKMNTATMFSDLIILLSSKVGASNFLKNSWLCTVCCPTASHLHISIEEDRGRWEDVLMWHFVTFNRKQHPMDKSSKCQ